eukprot:8922267-Lingulodinium_polyedra.AAC.1
MKMGKQRVAKKKKSDATDDSKSDSSSSSTSSSGSSSRSRGSSRKYAKRGPKWRRITTRQHGRTHALHVKKRADILSNVSRRPGLLS